MKKNHVGQAVLRGLFLCYLTALLLITVFRPWSGSWQLMGGRLHLTFLKDYVSIFHNSIPVFIYLFVGNIIWFVPFGFYICGILQNPLLRTVWAGFLFSLFIEIMQYVLGTGITETDDLLLNTVGCLIGAMIGAGVQRIIRGRRLSLR